MPVTRSCGGRRRKIYEEDPTASVTTEVRSSAETTTTEGVAVFSSPSSPLPQSTPAISAVDRRRPAAAVGHAAPTTADADATSRATAPAHYAPSIATTATSAAPPAAGAHVTEPYTTYHGVPLLAAPPIVTMPYGGAYTAITTPAVVTSLPAPSNAAAPATASSARAPDAPQPIAAQPAPMSNSRRMGTQSCSQRFTQILQLARAREEHARLQVELTAARIAVLEAEAAIEAEQMEEDARTAFSDGETAQRVDNWLHNSETHILAIVDQAHQDSPRKNQQPLQRDRALPEATASTPPPQPPSNEDRRPPAPLPEAIIVPPGIPAPRPNTAVALQPLSSPRGDIAELAAAITLAARQSQLQPYASRQATDLPFFNGNHQEWLCFKAAYNETARFFSETENTSRLRRNLKGRAREAVDNLLVQHTQPENIMHALESRFGRPDAIASAELDRLRNLAKPADTPRDICIFASRVTNIVAALKALNKIYYLYNPEITKMTSEKLPSTLRYRWFDFAASQPGEEPDLLKLARFLQREADLCSPFAQPENIVNEKQQQPQQKRQQQRTFTSQERPADQCLSCENTGHSVATCKRFIDATINERWDIAKKLRLCFRCLRFRNQKHYCKTKKCTIEDCRYYHHKLLHHLKTPPNTEEKQVVTSSWMKKRAQAYLKIAPVRISGPAGEVDTWALLDDGSTVTLLETSLAEEVGARGRVDPLNIEAIADTKLSSKRSRRVSVTLQGRTHRRHRIVARTIEELKLSPQKIEEADLRSCPHLDDLTGDLITNSAVPRLLIGQDNWHLLLAEETRRGRKDQPVASLTPLGWVLHGAHTRALGQRVNFVSTSYDQEEHMDEQLKHHFAMENLMIQPNTPRSDPELRALEILEKNTKHLEDGHYETALLWKEDTPQMPYNYEAAVKRLNSIEKKLKKDTVLAKKYHEQMNSVVEKGYAELAPPTKTLGKTWYLPHFAVINPMKPEKTRIVHDAAAKTNGKSLNDFLLTGPDLLQSLPGVLMRFRQHAIAVSADISEMFMQVKVRPEDRDALRYLWRENTDDSPTEYRMTSLIFGATCSPSIAIYVKDKNAQQYAETLPEAASAIVRKHYVDDYLDSYETVERAVKIAKEVKKIHRKGHYELKKWTSNSPEALRELANETETPSTVAISESSNVERVLGLVWRPSADELAFNLDLARVPEKVLQSDAPTKREALKIVMSIYDPLGFASPVTVRAKQILQELWRRGTGWDERIDTDLADQWQEWMGHLRNLHRIALPRCYLHYSDCISLQLHTLVDASEAAYSSALYWRAITPSGEIVTTLVTAKARVAPLKLTSIPRLELQAAVMGARMAAAVIEEHDRKPDKKFFWSDSKTVITWVKTGSRSYKPFVAHRIAAIEEYTSVQEWHWLPSALNSADDATRNVPHNFTCHHRWFTGPDFLRQHEDTWPVEKVKVSEPTGEEKCVIVRMHKPNFTQAIPNAERFSKWERYLRATARTLQFIDLCRPDRERIHYKRNKKNKEKDPLWKRAPKTHKKNIETTQIYTSASRRYKPLDASTLRRAEVLIIKASQGEAFAEEIIALQRGDTISPSSRLRPLSLSYKDGIVRIKSRIEKTNDVTDAMKAPPVLDGNLHSVRLIIENVHRQLHHAGVETTINECRQHFWILRLRPVTRIIIHSCIPCRIRRNSPTQPPTGNHPSCRLAHHRRPFTFTGLDYFGPVLTSSGRSIQKRYVAIFTCLTTRAVHLELAASLNADSAVMALRRMFSRRGCPTEIWSDNGTNLHAADKEMRRAADEAVQEEAERRQITWKYLPPGSPFMAGAWERLVRSVKTALAATHQDRHPTDEVLATLLAEAEYTVNSRPLTHVSVHPDDPEAITPNHFLLGGSARVPTPGAFNDGDLIGRTHWRASQRLADIFWSRWLREYLPDLQHRREPHGKGPPLKEGDVVLIVDSNLPRNTWPRGVVTATYPGPDGIVRVVDVRTKGGILRRPTKKLVVIPTDPGVPPAKL